MTATTPDDAVTVRMYNVGFGDAFLILFPRAGQRALRVLVDCGTHFGGKGPRPLPEVVQGIVDDVTDDDGVARIDVVVATHRHQDHVKGFEETAWAKVEVDEVWLPWIENPADPEGRAILERQSGTAKDLARGLQAVAAALAADGDERERHRVSAATAIVDNALTNAVAMATLHRGFARNPTRRYLPEEPRKRGRSATELRQKVLPGVRVHVLGPSRDPDVIADMDPPAGASYFWLDGLGPLGDPDASPPSPFAAGFELQAAAFDRAYPGHALDERDRSRVGRLGQTDVVALAASLDRAVNGTSLVLAFEIGKAVLLFPGDAQWGTWNAMLGDPAARAVIDRATFLKVGHHGSHNATPVAYVEGLEGDDRLAMVSTRSVPRWKQIPKVELLAALDHVTAGIARSDEGIHAPDAFETHTSDVVVAEVPI